MDDPNPRVRESVADHLRPAFSADECLPVLVHLLDDPEARVRTAAAVSLSRFNRDAVAALPRLLESLKDPDGCCRMAAAWAVWSVGEKKHREVVAVLRQGLSDGDLVTRIQAARVIGDLGKDAIEAFPELAELAVHDGIPAVRQTAVISLRAFGPSAVPVLAKMLRDPVAEVRMMAADALGGIGPNASDAIPALQAVLGDNNAQMREHVREALRRIDPEQFPAVAAEPK